MLDQLRKVSIKPIVVRVCKMTNFLQVFKDSPEKLLLILRLNLFQNFLRQCKNTQCRLLIKVSGSKIDQLKKTIH